MIGLRSRAGARRRLLAAAAISALAGASAVAQPAWGEASAIPFWKLSSRAAPTNMAPGGEGALVVIANNLGAAEVNGEAEKITITDTLPAGFQAIKVQGQSERGVKGQGSSQVPMECSAPASVITCTFSKNLPPFVPLVLRITVKAPSSASAPVNTVTVSGGMAKEAKIEQPVRVSSEPTSFGVEKYELTPENEDGSEDTEAGSHPFQLTTTFDLNQSFSFKPTLGEFVPSAPALQKDLTFDLPPGLIGNPLAAPQCAGIDFGAEDEKEINSCPEDTAIGVAVVSFDEPETVHVKTWIVPVFNLVPAAGEPARFGFTFVHIPIVLDTSVRTGEGYGVAVSVRNAPESAEVLGAEVTIWGVPADPRHDEARGWNCLGARTYAEGLKPELPCEPSKAKPDPFLELPTSCSALRSTVAGEAWSGATLTAENSSPTTLKNCSGLPFSPTIALNPDEHSASTPTGMTVEVNVPQEGTLTAGEPGEADINATTLALPPGVTASSGAANGLLTCGTGEAGFFGAPTTGPVLIAELEAQHFTPAAAACPEAAKIGTVRIKTPLLEKEVIGGEKETAGGPTIPGGVYVASQDTNPFASPLVLYLVAEEAKSNVLVKLAGEVRICRAAGEVVDGRSCAAPGQLISRFANTPPVPFERLRLHLFNGGQASQATPPLCGPYRAEAEFTPSSGGAVKVAGHEPAEGFQITSGPGGGPCPPSPLPFGPGVSAGALNTQAGAFTPFSLTLGHPDGQQQLTGLSMHLPPGAAAMLSNVTPCPVAQADAGTCGAASLIGVASTSAGLGGAPVTLPGKVYLTEKLDGAPFGISVDTNAEHVGPFNIGTIIANSTIQVNPSTAAATISTVETRINEASGGTTIVGSLPTMIKGVPVQLKQVHVEVNRPAFEFNPTNCNSTSVGGVPMEVTDTLSGAEGASASAASKYAVTNCSALPFSPTLTATVAGKGSKANGTTFTVKVTSSPGQANIAKTFLTIPSQLPSRLTTIQKACPAATFEANPATCPEGSNIGFAVAHTPVLHNPLVGPAYLVSHGNAAFPDVEFVLQGENITLVLDGKTNIKNGVTYSRFEAVPDAPVSTFETVLPAGPHSALTTNVPENENFSLCKKYTSIPMPTEINAQNGTVIKKTTSVAITGCPPTVKITAAKVKGSALMVTVKLSQAGTVKISGAGLRTLTKHGLKAGTHTIKVSLTKAGLADKRRHRKIKFKATVTVGHQSASASRTMKA